MRKRIAALVLFSNLIAINTPIHASSFTVTNLASDQNGVAASTDPTLINPWGIASSATSPFFLGVNGSKLSEVYDGSGTKQALEVSIQHAGNVTGVAFNNGPAAFNGDSFLFASEDGTISGWRSVLGSTAEILQTPLSGNVYKGLTTATIGSDSYALVANFRAGTIDVLKGSGGAPDLPGNFLDPNLPAGYAPFNIQYLGGSIYVTYALQAANQFDDVAGAGHGFINRFDQNGVLQNRLVTGGDLDSPWGLTLASSSFGDFAGALLVGNNGDGRIHAYDPVTGTLLGAMLDENDTPIVLDGLWGLSFGNGGSAGSVDDLYFTAGPADGAHGLFGAIRLKAGTNVPEPSSFVLLCTALLGILTVRRRMVRA